MGTRDSLVQIISNRFLNLCNKSNKEENHQYNTYTVGPCLRVYITTATCMYKNHKFRFTIKQQTFMVLVKIRLAAAYTGINSFHITNSLY